MPKYEFLHPWWRALTAYHVRFAAARSSSSIYDDRTKLCAVRIVLPSNLPTGDMEKSISDHCRELRDALELVLLLSVVDRDAFVEWASDYYYITSEEPCIRRALSRQNADNVHWHVDLLPMCSSSSVVLKSLPWIRAALGMMLTPQRLQDRTQSFQDAYHQLKIVGFRPTDTLTISVAVAVDNAIVPGLSSLLRGLRGSPIVKGYPFREAVLDVQANLDSDALAQLHACLRDPARCCRVRLGDVSIRTHEYTEQIAYGHELALLLLHPTPNGDQSTVIEGPVATTASGARVHATASRDPFLLYQLCSTVMYSQAIDSLTTNWAPTSHRTGSPERHKRVRWIAAALFSHYASHTIRHVHLRNFSLSRDECEDLYRLLEQSNPIASLLNHASTQPSYQVLVAAHTELWLHHPANATTGQGKSVPLTDASWLDVATDDERDVEYCDVLVPAYGVCRLRRLDCRARQSRQPSTKPTTITSLVLDMVHREADQRDGLCRFLGLVGAPLTALTVVGVGNVAPCCLDAIWLHCVSLQRLRLTRVSSAVLTALVDAYETGACRVPCLELRRVGVPRNCTSVVQFFDALADPTRAISQTLRELTFGLWRDYAHRLTQAEASAVAQMLEVNTTLVSFMVGLDLRVNSDLVEVCATQNGQWLPGRKAPLPSRAKFAFLSVMAFGGSRGANSSLSVVASESSPPARGQLDSDVITRIFEMAAHPMERNVRVAAGVYL